MDLFDHVEHSLCCSCPVWNKLFLHALTPHFLDSSMLKTVALHAMLHIFGHAEVLVWCYISQSNTLIQTEAYQQLLNGLMESHGPANSFLM